MLLIILLILIGFCFAGRRGSSALHILIVLVLVLVIAFYNFCLNARRCSAKLVVFKLP
jgi:hypothetical protein